MYKRKRTIYVCNGAAKHSHLCLRSCIVFVSGLNVHVSTLKCVELHELHKYTCKQARCTEDRLSHGDVISSLIGSYKRCCDALLSREFSYRLCLHSRLLCCVYPASHSADFAHTLITHTHTQRPMSRILGKAVLLTFVSSNY